MVKVSVVIPVYNNVSYIRECMESVINQTLQEIEIIPVDAGSTDGTREILEEYAKMDSRIRLLHSEKKSMGAQTNMGIAAATGEYIGFCESDDYLALTMYERLYTIVTANQLDYVKTDYDMFIDQDTRLFLNYHVFDARRANLYNSILNPMDIPEHICRDARMWNGIYKRTFILNNNIKLNETPKAAFQDTGFILQTFALSKRIMYVQEESNKYRYDNMNSSVFDWKCFLFVVWEFEYVYTFLASRRIQNQRFLAYVLQKFLVVYCEYYGRLPHISDFTDEIKDAIKIFKTLFKKLYYNLDYNERTFTILDSSFDLKLLLEDNPIFDTYRREMLEFNQKRQQDFYEQICRLPRVVIFGAGECGTACYVMLKKNGYMGVMCFCDNNERLWNQELMGLKVLSIKEVLDSNQEDIAFIIANVNHWQEIYNQLLSLGVKEDRIYRSVTMGAHAAFEVNLCENGNKKQI